MKMRYQAYQDQYFIDPAEEIYEFPRGEEEQDSGIAGKQEAIRAKKYLNKSS